MKNIHPLEYSWQALHLVDTMQTLHIAENPDCMREIDPYTSRLIGDSPDKNKVYQWAIGTSILNFYVNRWIDKKLPSQNFKLRLAANLYKLNTVNSNFDKGFGVNDTGGWIQDRCELIRAARQKNDT